MKKLLIFVIMVSSIYATDIEGKIAMYGNEPFTYLAITTKDNKIYKIVDDKSLSSYQGEIIKVDAHILKEPDGMMEGEIVIKKKISPQFKKVDRGWNLLGTSDLILSQEIMEQTQTEKLYLFKNGDYEIIIDKNITIEPNRGFWTKGE